MLSFRERIRFGLKKRFGRNEIIRNAQRRMVIGFSTSISIALIVGAGLSIVRDDGVSTPEAFLLFMLSMLLLFFNFLIIGGTEDEQDNV